MKSPTSAVYRSSDASAGPRSAASGLLLQCQELRMLLRDAYTWRQSGRRRPEWRVRMYCAARRRRSASWPDCASPQCETIVLALHEPGPHLLLDRRAARRPCRSRTEAIIATVGADHDGLDGIGAEWTPNWPRWNVRAPAAVAGSPPSASKTQSDGARGELGKTELARSSPAGRALKSTRPLAPP